MNTKLLMMTSSIFMGILGILFTFLPEETLNYAGFISEDLNTLFLQIMGALYFSFGLLNWKAKGNLIGGIYSKPVSLGNFAHFFIGGLATLKEAWAQQGLIVLWIAGILYALFAIFFGLVTFGNPLEADE